MLHNLFLAAALTAPVQHDTPQVLNGAWEGHIDAQSSAEGCPLDQCKYNREPAFVFQNGKFMYGKDAQVLHMQDDNWFSVETHGQRQIPQGSLNAYWTYMFRVVDAELQTIVVETKTLTRIDGTTQQGCTCSYTGVLAPAK